MSYNNKTKNATATEDDKNFEQARCVRCVWYLLMLDDAEKFLQHLRQQRQQRRVNSERDYREFELKIDTDKWSSVSRRYETLDEILTVMHHLYDAVDAANRKSTLISVRMFFVPSATVCKTMAVNTARHRCKACVDNYKDYRTCDRSTLKPYDSLQFGCTSNAQMRANSLQTQTHMSNLAFQREGDGTFYPQSAVIKDQDPPGQSLLKQAIRVGRGEAPDYVPDRRITHPQFETFSADERPALVPDAAAPVAQQIHKRQRRIGAFSNNVLLAQTHHAKGCREDQFDIEQRQQGNWYEQHFSGKMTRENYYIEVAKQNGVSKFEIVDALVDN